MITDPTFFQKELLGYVVKRVKDKSLAEDLVHDVFLKVQSKSSQLQNKEKEIGWIYRIAQNVILDYYRSKSRAIDETLFDIDNDDSLNQCVERCISEKMVALPAKYREALELSEMQGLSQLDLARQLNISYSGAKSRVQRARQMLREMLEKDYHVELDGYGNVIRCENRVPCNCQ